MDGAKGRDAKKWSSRCGVLVRALIPKEFDINLDPTIARLFWREEAENPECKPTRAKAWKVAHTSRKIGEVLLCAVEKYALIIAAEERQKSEASVNGNEGVISLEDFERDAVAEVFGNDKKRSYCRAISSTSNAKHVKLTQASKEIISYKKNEDKQWKLEMQQKIDQMHEESRITNSTLAEMQQCIRQLVSQIGPNLMTLRTEIGSHTEHHPSSTPTPSNAILDPLRLKEKRCTYCHENWKW